MNAQFLGLFWFTLLARIAVTYGYVIAPLCRILGISCLLELWFAEDTSLMALWVAYGALTLSDALLACNSFLLILKGVTLAYVWSWMPASCQTAELFFLAIQTLCFVGENLLWRGLRAVPLPRLEALAPPVPQDAPQPPVQQPVQQLVLAPRVVDLAREEEEMRRFNIKRERRRHEGPRGG